MAPRWLRAGVAAPLLLGVLVGQMPAARANFVPYVYVPQRIQLEGTGLGIAQAAARLLQMGQANEAARLAALTVQLLPNDSRGWLLLAEAQLRSKQLSEAGIALANAKKLDPRNPNIWFAEGALALRDGKPKEAIGLLEQGLKLKGNNAGAYFDIGNAHIQLAQPAAALVAFKQAVTLRRDFWEAINNQGLVLFEQGKTKEAIARWRQVLKITPDGAEPTLALATGLLNESPANRKEALELATKALTTDPNYVLESYQKDQLWGPKLLEATQKLLAQSELKAIVERAKANANPDGNNGDDG